MSAIVTLGAVILVLAFFAMLIFSRWCLRKIAVALVGVGIAYAGVVVWFSNGLDRVIERRNGPRHVFELSGQTEFLEETEALERARETLLLDGFTNAAWEPARDGRTAAPDGRADIFLVRNTQNPRRGVLMFTNAQGAQSFLQLEIEWTNVVCQRIAGK